MVERTLKAHWEDLWERMCTVNPNFNDKDHEEQRHMFYMGATSLMSIQHSVSVDSDSEALCETMELLNTEIAEYQMDLEIKRRLARH